MKKNHLRIRIGLDDQNSVEKVPRQTVCRKYLSSSYSTFTTICCKNNDRGDARFKSTVKISEALNQNTDFQGLLGKISWF
jgi:hypothetical protein